MLSPILLSLLQKACNKLNQRVNHDSIRPNSTLNFLDKKRKEKARIIFLPCIFLSMLINNSFIFFDHILRSRTCYQTHFGTELKSILLSLSFLIKYGKLVENCESKFSRRANKGNATNFARACKYKRYNV